MNTQSNIEKFKQLSYQEKLDIATNIITNLKNRWNTQAQEIFEYMNNSENISESFLESIYEDFENSIEKIKEKRVEGELHAFQQSHNYIKELREQEAQEMAQEDPDSLLEQI